MESGAITRTSGLLVSLAAFVVIIAGMKAAAPLLVPFLLALFIAVIIASPYSWLQARGLPSILALMVVLGLFIGIVFLIGTLIGTSVGDFSRNLPEYQVRLKENIESLVAWLDNKGIHTSGEIVSSYMDPAKAMKMVANIISSMGGLLTNGFLIMITVIFLMLEAASFPGKWCAARSNAENSLGQFYAAVHNINQYMGIKTLTSLATGIAIAVWLTILGVDYPLLWGLLAFLLNFVPNIGSIIAAVPAVLLALVQLGVVSALLTGLGFLVVNITIGTFLEPRVMGKGLGLSTLVVFLSLIFWGWVLGPVGMLLSVPLTIAIKIALDSHDNTRWMAIMLGPGVESGFLPVNQAQVPETDIQESGP
jgi:predicted PurR-regulated permease PerM